jgi:hypothetical protein
MHPHYYRLWDAQENSAGRWGHSSWDAILLCRMALMPRLERKADFLTLNSAIDQEKRYLRGTAKPDRGNHPRVFAPLSKTS